jgi:peptide chain release factor 1
MNVLDCCSGFTLLKISGNNPLLIFNNEAGGHRWQRTPPNERNGRVHTSTITVSVFVEPKPMEFILSEKDLEIKTCRGAGNGGQNRNKLETTVIVTHIPTKTTVRCESERSQYQNRQIAIDLLRTKLYNNQNYKMMNDINGVRKQQIGSGMRGDKRRTIACQRNSVVDHITNKKWTLDQYYSGKW